MLDYIISHLGTHVPHPYRSLTKVLQAIWIGVSYLLCHLRSVFPFHWTQAKLEYSQRLLASERSKVFADSLLE